MSNETLYILLPDFAEHEMVYLAEAIASDEFSLKEKLMCLNRQGKDTCTCLLR